MDEKTKEWIGGETIVVQTGDILDRGSTEIQCYSRLAQLDAQARRQGGRIERLLGNHEADNYCGDYSYVSTEANKEFSDIVSPILDHSCRDWKKRILKMYPDTPPEALARAAALCIYTPVLHESLKAFRCVHKVAIKVGDSLFVHGGLIRELIDKSLDLPSSYSSYQKEIFEKCRSDGIQDMNLKSLAWVNSSPSPDGSIPRFLTDNRGPLWYREYCSADSTYFGDDYDQTEWKVEKEGKAVEGEEARRLIAEYKAYRASGRQEIRERIERELDDVLSFTGCKRMVVGHTPTAFINGCFGGKLWRIDTAVSAEMRGGVGEALEITQRAESSEVDIRILTEDTREIQGKKAGELKGEQRLVISPSLSAAPSEFSIFKQPLLPMTVLQSFRKVYREFREFTPLSEDEIQREMDNSVLKR